MAGKDRKKQLARQRYARQEQRRQAQAAKARRLRIIGSAVAVVVVAGGAAAIAIVVGGDDKSKAAGPEAAASPTPTVKPGECGYNPSKDDDAPKDLGKPPVKPAHTGEVKAKIKTSQGDIGLKLDGKKAPCTVNSFAFLAEKDFWKKSHCHRLSTSEGLKMLQCGDPTAKGTGGPGYQFANENTSGAKYPKGTVAMANSGADTNGSQFFLVYGDSQLPPSYTVFGEITSGLDELEKVAKAGVVKAGEDGTGEPKKKVTIQDVTIAGK